jgi:hypothetical protein
VGAHGPRGLAIDRFLLIRRLLALAGVAVTGPAPTRLRGHAIGV